MLIAIWVGMVLAVYTTLTGYGWHLAQARLPASRAAAIARNQPPVADEKNAAVVYDRAFAAVVPWTKLVSDNPGRGWKDADNPDRFKEESWREPATFAPDSPLIMYVHANAEAIRLLSKGTSFSEVDWGIPTEDFPNASMARLSRSSQCWGLLGRDAVVAAHAQDWPRAIARIRSAAALTDHARRGIGCMAFLIGTSGDRGVANFVAYCLSVPGFAWERSELQELFEIAKRKSDSRMHDLHRALIDEEATSLLVIDQLGCGDLTKISDVNGLTRIPLPMSHYSAGYPLDRLTLLYYLHGAQDATLARAEGRIPDSATPDIELNQRTDPRLVYHRLCGGSATGLLMPVVGVLASSESNRQTRWRLVASAVQVLSWIREHGRVPVDLTAITLDPILSTDTFGGHRFLLRREGDLLRLWSFGPNKRDETSEPPTKPHPKPDDIAIVVRLPVGTP